MTTPPGAWPTDEEIEAVLVQAAVDVLAVQTETVVKRSDFYRRAAEMLSARLRPAFENDPIVLAFGTFRRDVRHATGEPSNPGWSDDDVISAIRKIREERDSLRATLAACAAVLKKIADADILPLHGRREVRAALARPGVQAVKP